MDFKCDELILGKTDADSRALTLIINGAYEHIFYQTGGENAQGKIHHKCK